MNEKTSREYGYPVCRSFTQNNARYEKGSLYKPDNAFRKSWLSELQRHGLVSAMPECREIREPSGEAAGALREEPMESMEAVKSAEA